MIEEVPTEFNQLFVFHFPFFTCPWPFCFESVNSKHFLWIHEAFVNIFHFKTAIFLVNLWRRVVLFDFQTEISLKLHRVFELSHKMGMDADAADFTFGIYAVLDYEDTCKFLYARNCFLNYFDYIYC